MKKFSLIFLMLSSLLFAAKVEFEVLGSGGPEIDGRASTAYLLWIDNKARLIIDMGSGSMLRFEQSHAKIEDLEAVVLTHLHIDHSVDLPAFVKAGYFSQRTKSLDIIAPDGNEFFPSATEFLHDLFGENGAYRYMNDVLTQESDSFEIIPVNVSKTMHREYQDFKLTMVRVHHGIVPALAVKISIDGKIIVISGDTNNENHILEAFAKDADLFVAHHAIPQQAKGYATNLHMSPSIIAHIAQVAKVKKVVSTHRMNRTIGFEPESLQEIKKIYKGEVVFAEDRMKIEVK
ncbi:MBL fold metallo-hydrolase [Sulfurimonas paralvinellae]|uniref:MBL fold metallo-hydrolase n=1 Tax=Sulfurimonas paralvinellae TaxID=317658 RepID=A0A7M1BAY3_9BACT|nr:MBL fold metallo-hydrolase [Sulfurimonas paralvinellae]QOP46586.1 MBL fold metallo-hydrolase [Sulfurimonas paralvinellae]